MQQIRTFCQRSWCHHHRLRMKGSTFIMQAGFRYCCSSLFFTQSKAVSGSLAGVLSVRMALKKNTFLPTELSVLAALGSLYLQTPQGALLRKDALKPSPAGKRTGSIRGRQKVEAKTQHPSCFLYLFPPFWVNSVRLL